MTPVFGELASFEKPGGPGMPQEDVPSWNTRVKARAA